MIEFLSNIKNNLILVCHNGFCYDFPILIKKLKHFDISLPDNILGFSDTLPAFKKHLKCESYKLGSIVTWLGIQQEFQFHNSYDDVIALLHCCREVAKIYNISLTELHRSYFKDTVTFVDKFTEK